MHIALVRFYIVSSNTIHFSCQGVYYRVFVHVSRTGPSFCDILIFAATSNHGNTTAAREVKVMSENIITSFVVGTASSLLAAWLYDVFRKSGKH